MKLMAATATKMNDLFNPNRHCLLSKGLLFTNRSYNGNGFSTVLGQIGGFNERQVHFAPPPYREYFLPFPPRAIKFPLAYDFVPYVFFSSCSSNRY